MLNRIKQVAILIFTLTISLALLSASRPATKAADDETTPVNYSDTVAAYKAKCNLCHKANAEKAFDLTKPDEHHIEIILKGKKVAKPPHMPSYETKGMNTEQAKAFVTYMRQLRAAAPKNSQ